MHSIPPPCMLVGLLHIPFLLKENLKLLAPTLQGKQNLLFPLITTPSLQVLHKTLTIQPPSEMNGTFTFHHQVIIKQYGGAKRPHPRGFRHSKHNLDRHLKHPLMVAVVISIMFQHYLTAISGPFARKSKWGMQLGGPVTSTLIKERKNEFLFPEQFLNFTIVLVYACKQLHWNQLHQHAACSVLPIKAQKLC